MDAGYDRLMFPLDKRLISSLSEIGSCRIALVSYGNSHSEVVTPLALRWAAIKAQALTVQSRCVATQNIGGFAIIKGEGYVSSKFKFFGSSSFRSTL